jgi:signal transduction histidine kinase
MDFLARTQNASKRMKTMLDALLKYSRVTTRADQFQLVNLTDCVKEALSNLQPRIEQADARIELDDLPSIEGDFDQFIQLFQNLIGNSLKFHHKNRPPEVKITGYIVTPDPEKQLKSDQSDRMLSDDYCKILIEDNGIGFDEKFLERIFLPFQRLHGRFDYEGTGMGLAICRKIIARHGGRILAMSQPESGATFIVAIPLKQEKQIKTTTEKLSVV